MRTLIRCVAAMATLLCSAVAQASVIYEFSATKTDGDRMPISTLNVSFVYESPDFVTSTLSPLTPSGVISCSASGTWNYADAACSSSVGGMYPGNFDRDDVVVYVAGVGGVGFWFPLGSFGAFGTYYIVPMPGSGYTYGTLVVRSGTPVPIAPTLALFGVGLAGLGLAKRRKAR